MSEKGILEGFEPGPAEVDEVIRRNQYSPEFAFEELSWILNGYLNETFIGHADVWEYILPLLKKTVVLQGGCKVLDDLTDNQNNMQELTKQLLEHGAMTNLLKSLVNYCEDERQCGSEDDSD